jgi:hypothetical protein
MLLSYTNSLCIDELNDLSTYVQAVGPKKASNLILQTYIYTHIYRYIATSNCSNN